MPARFYSYEEAAAQVGVSVSTLKRKVRAGDFPSPVRLSPGRVGFPAHVIQARTFALGLALETVGVPQVAQTLQAVAAQLDSLCWIGDASNPLEGSLRKQLAAEIQAVLAGILALADKYDLAENVWLDLYGPALGGERLTRIEAMRQLCQGSRNPGAFAETLRLLAGQVAATGVQHD